jgi:hypothetical protein
MTNRPPHVAGHRAIDLRTAPLTLAVLSAMALAGCIPSIVRGSAAAGASSGAAGAGPTVDPRPSGPTPIPSFVPPTPTPAPTFLVYVVAKGDNLNTIAHKFGTTARSLAYWNRGTYPSLDPESPSYKPNLVRLGWSLVLIPRVVVDEQTLPGPTPNPTDPSDAEPMASG